ncbi:monovalent cation/H+ antiporter subunit D family protein [Thalassospiraceae bacterium LMO-JJ14]|nr:monovalent cation/H+ antiporter subunit D family protein [Thalassospiraceae bacterium LMO-JJ14]
MTFLAEHISVLVVIVPLMAAPFCVIVRNGTFAWGWATLIAIVNFFLSVVLIQQVMANGTIVYNLGDWDGPWGIVYHVDELGALVVVIVSAIAAVVMPYAKQSIEREIPSERHYLAYCMMLLCTAGLIGMAVTGDAFNLFVFLEVSSLATYVLISLGDDRRALTASLRYLILGTLGATFYVIGLGMVYMMTGSLNMTDLASLLPAVQNTATIHAALAFIVVGFGLKLALFPLHVWLPNAYTFAPSAVTAFLAATATKVAVYALIRLIFTVFGDVDPLETYGVRTAVMVLAIVGMFAGSLVAIYQSNVKRLLAYSSVAQVGYMILGMSIGNAPALAGGIIHMFNHALMKGGLFMALGCVYYVIGSVKLEDMAGLAKRMPLTAAAIVAGGFSLIGVPLTVGFISKFYLVEGALAAGLWPVALLIMLSSLLAVIYVWRVVEIMYFRNPAIGNEDRTEAPLTLLVPTYVLLGAAFWFGIDATYTGEVAMSAAQTLLGGSK